MRRAWDAYFTPTSAVHALMERIDLRDRSVLEPCAGDGAVVRPISEVCGLVRTNDLNPSMKADTCADATDPAWWRNQPPVDWVISNPPFSVAADIVPLAHQKAVCGVAMLLRLSYLEPCENRAAWLAKHPPTGLIVLPRISFTGDGKTDNVTCAWMVWMYPTFNKFISIVPKASSPEPAPMTELFA
jgi:hypothetical protein